MEMILVMASGIGLGLIMLAYYESKKSSKKDAN